MSEINDSQLLIDFGQTRSESAFRAIVQRHAGMVSATAQRLLRNPAKAEEVTQAVFILLARKAASLSSGTCLGGWLYRTARYLALEHIRAESRRERWKGEYAVMNETSPAEAAWTEVWPHLDQALAQLREADRDALVLRFLEEQSFAAVAKALRTTEPAAKMRVNRALDKLREALVRTGVRVSGTALLTALTTHAGGGLIATAPEALATIALQGGTGAAPAALGLIDAGSKALAAAKLKFAATLTLVALSLLTVSGIAFLKLRAPHLTAPASGFTPVAGNWTGLFRFGTEAQGISFPAEVSIQAAPDGRDCVIKIDMPRGPDGGPANYYFTHQLNSAGDRIFTGDDPQVATSNGEGIVTDSFENSSVGEWRLGFRTPTPNGIGVSECVWIFQRGELTIIRKDSASANSRADAMRSELRLRRAAEVTTASQ